MQCRGPSMFLAARLFSVLNYVYIPECMYIWVCMYVQPGIRLWPHTIQSSDASWVGWRTKKGLQGRWSYSSIIWTYYVVTLPRGKITLNYSAFRCKFDGVRNKESPPRPLIVFLHMWLYFHVAKFRWTTVPMCSVVHYILPRGITSFTF